MHQYSCKESVTLYLSYISACVKSLLFKISYYLMFPVREFLEDARSVFGVKKLELMGSIWCLLRDAVVFTVLIQYISVTDGQTDTFP